LVSLTESPFFLISIDEIEIIHFERVAFGLKNFDMSIIFKDYEKPCVRITAIPIEQFEIIKSWIEYVYINKEIMNVKLYIFI
jgi:nucleosome binding factor SPN SPT16 subunit